MKKYLSALFILFMMLLSFSPLNVFASESVDSSEFGSISVTVKSPDKKEPLKGVKFNFYRVGDVCRSGDRLSYTLSAGYKDSGVSLVVNDDNEFKKGTAEILTDFINSNGIKGICAQTNDSGTAFVGNCRTGLYLVVAQEMPADIPYGQADPFLISLPMICSDGNTLEYSVKATPKIPIESDNNTDVSDNNTATDNTATSIPNGTVRPTDSTSPTKPSQLPNTGMLKWPIPIMAAAGPLLFAFGYLDVIGRKKRNEK